MRYVVPDSLVRGSDLPTVIPYSRKQGQIYYPDAGLPGLRVSTLIPIRFSISAMNLLPPVSLLLLIAERINSSDCESFSSSTNCDRPRPASHGCLPGPEKCPVHPANGSNRHNHMQISRNKPRRRYLARNSTSTLHSSPFNFFQSYC